MVQPTSLILIGCVQTKLKGVHAARDLYVSNLFRHRKDYAESYGQPWFILSAKHGLLSPEEQIGYYDESLLSKSASLKRAWSQQVLSEIRKQFGSVKARTVEIHAGAPYWRFGLLEGLARDGGIVKIPLQHIRGIGPQIKWYQMSKGKSK